MATLKQKPPKKRNKSTYSQLASQAFGFLMIVALLYLVLQDVAKPAANVPLSRVAEEVNAQNVKNIVVKGDKLDVTLLDDSHLKTKKEPEVALTETLATYGVLPEYIRATPIDVKTESGFFFWLATILPILVPVVFLLLFFWFMSSQMKGMGGGMKGFSFGQSKARVSDPKSTKKQVTFNDVAGNTEAKVELSEIVDFLKFPKKFFDLGAKIPKGVLLTGDPGTGKTLMARAVAGEAGVPFFHLSGSEFVEMFVGVGASRVRDLFEQAKKVSPAIIFIDEIDAVGRARGVGFGGGNDEREQTLNQILVEMDGFEPTEKVVVVAATNRPDVLDQALLRPGRFDRRVYIDLPDRKDREAILKIHANEKPLASDVNLTIVAERTPGFSGADLESIMNEAAIFAARKNQKEITQTEVLESIEKVMMGPERKSHLHSKREREIVAYHEAGHAIVASVLPNADPIHKVTIIPRGRAGGYTLKIALEDKKFPSRSELLDDIAMSMGGYVAEQLVFKDITPGPSGDLQSSTRLARNMVMKWGMSEVLGPIAYEDTPRGSFGEGGEHQFSDQTEAVIDNEVSRILKGAHAKATEVLTEYRGALDAVAQKLLEVETLEQEAYNELVAKFGLQPKKLQD